MKLQLLPQNFSVCKLHPGTPLPNGICFFARTDSELSLVCETSEISFDTIAREDGWRGLRVAGTLEFSLIGILAGITEVLSGAGVSVFCVSTFDTDYVLVKEVKLNAAVQALVSAGYKI